MHIAGTATLLHIFDNDKTQTAVLVIDIPNQKSSHDEIDAKSKAEIHIVCDKSVSLEPKLFGKSEVEGTGELHPKPYHNKGKGTFTYHVEKWVGTIGKIVPREEQILTRATDL